MQDFVAFRARFLAPAKLDLQKLWGQWRRGAQNLFFDATFSYLSPHTVYKAVFFFKIIEEEGAMWGSVVTARGNGATDIK